MASAKKNNPTKTIKPAKKMDPVVHFEMPYEDRQRIAKFYSSAFGWQTNMLGEEYGDYAVTMTSETAKDGTPKKKGMINGGFYKKDKNRPAQYPSVVITVDNINKTMKKIEKAGGEVLGEPVEIKEMGMFVSFFDTEGNRIGVMEPFMKQK